MSRICDVRLRGHPNGTHLDKRIKLKTTYFVRNLEPGAGRWFAWRKLAEDMRKQKGNYSFGTTWFSLQRLEEVHIHGPRSRRRDKDAAGAGCGVALIRQPRQTASRVAVSLRRPRFLRSAEDVGSLLVATLCPYRYKSTARMELPLVPARLFLRDLQADQGAEDAASRQPGNGAADYPRQQSAGDDRAGPRYEGRRQGSAEQSAEGRSRRRAGRGSFFGLCARREGRRLKSRRSVRCQKSDLIGPEPAAVQFLDGLLCLATVGKDSHRR
jgi:hypothetical protein